MLGERCSGTHQNLEESPARKFSRSATRRADTRVSTSLMNGRHPMNKYDACTWSKPAWSGNVLNLWHVFAQLTSAAATWQDGSATWDEPASRVLSCCQPQLWFQPQAVLSNTCVVHCFGARGCVLAAQRTYLARNSDKLFTAFACFAVGTTFTLCAIGLELHAVYTA